MMREGMTSRLRRGRQGDAQLGFAHVKHAKHLGSDNPKRSNNST